MKKTINHKLSTINYTLVIGWLYPDLMNIYGDRGNVIVLEKRCLWRGIEVSIKEIGVDSTEKDLAVCDMLLMGGAQDVQQEIVAKDLQKKKKTLKHMIEEGTPGLYICGGFQFLGNYYKTADSIKLPQLGVLDMYTENPGRERLIGNIAISVDSSWLMANGQTINNKPSTINTVLVGFENHGGRTILGKNIQPLGKVLVGYGSNDSAKEEGAVYKNTIGTYFHGPILPKNPELADWLIVKAIERKYGSSETSNKPLTVIDDSISKKARDVMLKRLGVEF